MHSKKCMFLATAQWLSGMAKLGCQTWDGFNLSIPLNSEKRVLIQQRKASLLDFRNYLFCRQATLLLLLYRPWEVAQRSIPYIHNCMQELKMLEVQVYLLYYKNVFLGQESNYVVALLYFT